MANLGVSNLSGIASGFRNRIINGDFNIWQRGTSPVPATGGFLADRFMYVKIGTSVHSSAAHATAKPTLTQSGHYSNYAFVLRCTTADVALGAGDGCRVSQWIEGYNIQDLMGKICTLSFWVYATKTGTYCVSFQNDGVDRAYVVEYTVAAASTWQKITVTLTMDDGATGVWDFKSGRGLRVNWVVGCGSTYHAPSTDSWLDGNYWATSNQVNSMDTADNYFLLSQVQLEVGSVPTSFENRPYTQELVLCQRYYEKSFYWSQAPAAGQITGHMAGNCYAASALDVWIPFMVIKCGVPTMVYYPSADAGAANQWAYYIGGWNAGAANVVHVIDSYHMVRVTSIGLTVGHIHLVSGNWTADAEL